MIGQGDSRPDMGESKMIESHYSLNVSLSGKHYCRIHLGTWESDAQEKARTIRKAFGVAYECTLTYVECIGYTKKF